MTTTMMTPTLTLDQATRAYNELRRPGADHGINGAYTMLERLHGADALPTHMEILVRRSARVEAYRSDLRHAFKNGERAEFLALNVAERDTYNAERWYWGADHSAAMLVVLGF